MSPFVFFLPFFAQAVDLAFPHQALHVFLRKPKQRGKIARVDLKSGFRRFKAHCRGFLRSGVVAGDGHLPDLRPVKQELGYKLIWPVLFDSPK